MPGFHITQGIFQKMFTLLEEECHELDLKLAHQHSSDQRHGSFSPYAEALQQLHKAQEDLEAAKQSATVLEQLMVYLSVAVGQTNPLVQGLIQQSTDSRRNVQELVNIVNIHVHGLSLLYYMCNYRRVRLSL